MLNNLVYVIILESTQQYDHSGNDQKHCYLRSTKEGRTGLEVKHIFIRCESVSKYPILTITTK